jgi:hypothetical protein
MSAFFSEPKIPCGVVNTEQLFEYISKDDYNFQITNNGVEVISLFDKIETGNETLNESVGFDLTLIRHSKPIIETESLTLSSISDYTLIPNFSLYGDSDTKFNMTMGLDRNGHPQPAWTFGKSLLTFVDLQPTSDHSSFVKTVEYLPETKSITQIIYPGTYLLSLNAYSDTGSVAITIDKEPSVTVKIEKRYFTP